MIMFLCTADAWFSLEAIGSGRAVEANPLMNWALTQHLGIFVATKMSLTSLGCWLLFLRRDNTFAQNTSTLLLAFYYALTLYHIAGWSW
jgi:hypothetical protein